MASAAAEVLGSRIVSGLIIGPATDEPLSGFDFVAGGHPLPTAGSTEASRRALAVSGRAAAHDEVLVLLSGGASALMALPAHGVTLEDKQRTTDVLLRAGADIKVLNTVRKHLSAIKGGQLAAASDAACLTLAISDVVGDDASIIGSGPTVPDESTFADALRMIDGLGVTADCPPDAVARLSRGAEGVEPETPKPGDSRLARARASVIGGRHNAMRGATEEARSRGYRILMLEDPIIGEARSAATAYFTTMTRLAHERPLAIVSSGETTVHVTGGGRGGRNQEFALALVDHLPSLQSPVAVASMGTDGIDGSTDAAGAIVDSSSRSRARQAGLADPGFFLGDNNSWAFFDAIGDLIRTGPTGTNVGDLQVALFG
jgi:hydroxypyruvate reductase